MFDHEYEAVTRLRHEPTLLKKHYVVEGDADVVEESIRRTAFVSEGRDFELIFFDKGTNASNILISPGSGGHAYVLAELGDHMQL